MSSFKSNESIQKKEGGPDRSVSDNQSSSVTLNKPADKARKSYCNSEFQQYCHTMTDINPNWYWFQMIKQVENKSIMHVIISFKSHQCNFPNIDPIQHIIQSK